jgi:hypothetical protein
MEMRWEEREGGSGTKDVIRDRHSLRRETEGRAHGERLINWWQSQRRMQFRMVIWTPAVIPFRVHDVGYLQGGNVVKSRQTQTRRFGGEGRRSRASARMKR